MKQFMKKIFPLSLALFLLAGTANAGFERGNIVIDVENDFSIGDRNLSAGTQIDARLSQFKAGNEYYVIEDLAGNQTKVMKNSTLKHEDIARDLPLNRGLKVNIENREAVNVNTSKDSVLRGGCRIPVEITVTEYAIEGSLKEASKTVARFHGRSAEVTRRNLRSNCAGR